MEDLEKKNLEQIKEVQTAKKYTEELKLLLHEKDIIINDLRGKMNLSEEAEKNKYLEEKLDTCEKEKDAVSKANKILEENYKILNSLNMVKVIYFIGNYLIFSSAGAQLLLSISERGVEQ